MSAPYKVESDSSSELVGRNANTLGGVGVLFALRILLVRRKADVADIARYLKE